MYFSWLATNKPLEALSDATEIELVFASGALRGCGVAGSAELGIWPKPVVPERMHCCNIFPSYDVQRHSYFGKFELCMGRA
jgi:hypothetical protein